MKRHAKALQSKSRKCQVYPLGSGRFRVDSPSGNSYLLHDTADGVACSCDWSDYHDTTRRPCSHVLAVENWIEESHGRRLSFWATVDAADRQHRPLRQIGDGVWSTTRRVSTSYERGTKVKPTNTVIEKEYRLDDPESSEYVLIRIYADGKATVRHFEYYGGPTITDETHVDVEIARKAWRTFKAKGFTVKVWTDDTWKLYDNGRQN